MKAHLHQLIQSLKQRVQSHLEFTLTESEPPWLHDSLLHLAYVEPMPDGLLERVLEVKAPPLITGRALPPPSWRPPTWKLVGATAGILGLGLLIWARRRRFAPA